ncbi:MAG: helix-turn-helix domain-containing protein [Clostridia bacterium]|nr:helix-turn-helix domain-containing protein [Clostridia bacterium]
MFDTKKFGGYLSRLRKKADMTQSELADKLYLTRQAISRYELGDSFPDISILVNIADIFGVTLDELINSGEPTHAESKILESIADGKTEPIANDIRDIIGIAPLLKPSVLGKLSDNLIKQGIDISGVVELAEYLNDENVIKMLENVSLDKVDDMLLEKLMPILDSKSKTKIFQKILDGEMDYRFLSILIEYADYFTSQVEAAVVEGVLPWDALDLMRNGRIKAWEKRQKNTV